ncbi:beta-glucosidase BglX [Robertkochia marina]|uniref:beta-glucosidase n=1 Tax=Robertkochia marina TaxID=1227945 RepID=A0A4S3M3M3_9FLAO|nr:beta-glucosidase BglX [Robertkochia marina]THD69716.1 beta-glucosidase BglX [Robertkochia marina]TRZ46941.1 beta-glucosidase BglX [Robertkochia marina]
MKNISLLFILTAVFFSCKKEATVTSINDPITTKVDSLLAIMTLEEKVGQMNQYNGFWNVTGPAPKEGDAAARYDDLRNGRVGSMLNVTGVEEVRKVQKIAVEESRLGIPLIIGFDVIHGYKTISPIPLAEAASWNMELIRRSAEVAAREAAASGINWTFAPMVDISRDARWGRVMEGAGEDPYLGSLIAAARVTGFQGDDLSSPLTIAACAKHFAGYGFSEAGRDYNTVDVGTSTLYNTILPPFKAAKEAGVRTFMNSFNILNGIPATGNALLQRDILKGDWDFSGFVVSDWGTIDEMISHGYAKDGKDAALKAIKAGSDMDMESYHYLNHLKELVENGAVKEGLIDDAVRRILRLKFELGLFDDPYKYCDPEREQEIVGSDEHHAAVLEMAKNSIVLLKNENDLLPLKKEGLNIALIGPLADDKTSPLGNWRIAADDSTAVSVLEGLNAYDGNRITHRQGVKLIEGTPSFTRETLINTTDRSGISQAVAAARGKDAVIMVLGEHGFLSGEARSRASLDLPGLQQELLEAVYKVNKNVILVLMNGRPLTINWADKNIPAIVEAWQLGSESGHAIAQVLYGDHTPSGKLPMTFPKDVGQLPLYYNYMNTGRPNTNNPGEVFWSHYIDMENTPLYPFGHGLSYTSFKYDKLKISKDSIQDEEVLEVSFELTNTGERTGTETAQLYIRDHVASRTRPVKELKKFMQVILKPGETQTIIMTISEEDLAFYTDHNRWQAETGNFSIFIGGSSETSLDTSFYYKNNIF